MKKIVVGLMVTLVLGLLMSAPCLAQQSFVGTYKLVSVTRIIDGTPEPKPTKPPHGYIIVTPKYYILFYTDGDRRYGASVIYFFTSPLTKNDPFVLVLNDPQNAQLTSWQF